MTAKQNDEQFASAVAMWDLLVTGNLSQVDRKLSSKSVALLTAFFVLQNVVLFYSSFNARKKKANGEKQETPAEVSVL